MGVSLGTLRNWEQERHQPLGSARALLLVASKQPADRIARVLFTVVAGEAVLLHGFIKQSRKTPQPDLKTARKRKALLK